MRPLLCQNIRRTLPWRLRTSLRTGVRSTALATAASITADLEETAPHLRKLDVGLVPSRCP